MDWLADSLHELKDTNIYKLFLILFFVLVGFITYLIYLNRKDMKLVKKNTQDTADNINHKKEDEPYLKEVIYNIKENQLEHMEKELLHYEKINKGISNLNKKIEFNSKRIDKLEKTVEN